MAQSDRTIDVFLASPGDVEEERAAARRVVQDLAATYRQAGWSIRIWGWEQARPGLGRAQDLINPEVDQCDVLVGVLGRNWGTPTGDFTSGFEEEFERLRARREAGEEVDAMVFVRKLEPNEQAEPANLEFRERLRDLALYEPYIDVRDFELALQRALAAYIVERVSAPVSNESAPELPAQDQAGPEGPPTTDTTSGVPQSQASLRVVSDAVAGHSENLEPLDLVRAHLATAAELSNRRSRATLDVHDLFAAYEYRSKIEVTRGEILLIDRTMALNGYTAPGWGLTGEQDWAWRLGSLALRDANAEVRVGALRELGAAGIDALVADLKEPNPADQIDVYRRLLDDDDEGVRDLAAQLLSESRPEGAADLLADQFERTGSIASFKSLMPLLIDTDPEEAIRLAFEHPVWIDDFDSQLLGIAPAVPEAAIRAAHMDSSGALRLAIKLLAARGELGQEEAQAKLGVTSRAVRLAGLRALIEMGAQVDEEIVEAVTKPEDSLRSFLDKDAPEVRSLWIARLPTEELRDRAKWGQLGLAGPEALVPLLKRNENDGILEKIRAGLAGNMDPLREEGFEADVKRFGDSEEVRQQLWETRERYQDLHDSLWAAASLRGLAARGPEAHDVVLARQHIQSEDIKVRDAAAEILERAGSREDVPELVGYAGDRHGRETAKALRAAAQLVDRGEKLLDAIPDGKRGGPLLAPVLGVIYESELDLDIEAVRDLLHDRERDIRRAAVAVAVRDLSSEQLSELLESYTNADASSYYDVIGLLDRLIYAPAAVGGVARAWLTPTVE